MAEPGPVLRRTRYHWPDIQLNFWILVFLAASATLLGVFAQFMSIQTQMRLGIPWSVDDRSERGSCQSPFPPIDPSTQSQTLTRGARARERPKRYMPFWVVTGALGVIFVLVIIYLVSSRQLIPGVVILGSFVLFVLFLTGLIRIAMELFGATANINSYCTDFVQNNPSRGPTILTLAHLQQVNICKWPTFSRMVPPPPLPSC